MWSSADLALAILIHRVFAGMSQRQLAAKARVSEATLSAWKSGERKPDPKLVKRVATALGLPVAELEKTASYLAHRRRSTSTRWQIFAEVRELSDLGSLPTEQLWTELGRAHERRLAIEAEMMRRQGSSASDTSLQTPLPL
jgi:transcriptional regulator with XRE-family HTH domain